MRVKSIEVVLRKDGFFYHNGKQIKAVYPREGYAVMLFLDPSQIDVDFGEYTLVLTEEDRKKINELFDKSDEKTYQLRGRGWASGPRPYMKLHEFVER